MGTITINVNITWPRHQIVESNKRNHKEADKVVKKQLGKEEKSAPKAGSKAQASVLATVTEQGAASSSAAPDSSLFLSNKKREDRIWLIRERVWEYFFGSKEIGNCACCGKVLNLYAYNQDYDSGDDEMSESSSAAVTPSTGDSIGSTAASSSSSATNSSPASASAAVRSGVPVANGAVVTLLPVLTVPGVCSIVCPSARTATLGLVNDTCSNTCGS